MKDHFFPLDALDLAVRKGHESRLRHGFTETKHVHETEGSFYLPLDALDLAVRKGHES
ncbi:MAG: hypothetical protein FD143_3530, partial [Ignavibacteria bacterium]